MIALNNTYAGTGWYYGASLSFKLYFYCDYFVQTTGSDRYPIRGARSNNGLYCGIFSIVMNNISSFTDWARGACISFKLYTYYCDYFYQNSGGVYYAYRGGSSSSSNPAGVFTDDIAANISNNKWYISASISFKTLLL